jgi:peptidoglycan hydrolase-like protein with peptidoglycan-binding domain
MFTIALCIFTVTSANTLLFPIDLRQGVKNEVAVLVLQKFLKAERYYDGPLLGIYDTATMRAVQKFQQKYSISPDGLFQGKTRVMANTMVQKQMKEYSNAPKVLEVKIVTPNEQKKKAVQPAKPRLPVGCTISENRLKHGEVKEFFRYPIAVPGGTCHAQKRRCLDGYVDGDPGYRYASCLLHGDRMQLPTQTKSTNSSSGFCFDSKNGDTTVQLCATAAINGMCSNKDHPCAYKAADGMKACFVKVGDSCPKVPKQKPKAQ